jgi:hypothetical protein
MSAPNMPRVNVVNNGDGVSVTATVAGDAGVTNQLFYAAQGASGWTDGLTCVGNGTITQTGLSSGTQYTFIVVSSLAGANSVASLPAFCLVQPSALPIVEQLVATIQTAYQALVTNGTLLALVRPTQINEEMPLEHLNCVLVQFPVEPIERGTAYYRKRLTVGLICPVRPAKGDVTPIQQYQNFYGAKLENVALNSLGWSKLADGMTEIRGPFAFQEARKVDGVYLELAIPFRHLVTDTFQTVGTVTE